DVEFFVIVTVVVVMMFVSVLVVMDELMVMGVSVIMGGFMVMGVIVSVLVGGRGQRRRNHPSAEENVGKIPRRNGKHELDRKDDADGEKLLLPGKLCKGEDEQGFVVGRNEHGKEG